MPQVVFAGTRRPDRLAVDRLRHLPEAYALLLWLREERDNAHAPLNDLGNKLMDLRVHRSTIAQRMSETFEEVKRVDARTSLTEPVEDHPALLVERRRLADIDEEIAELSGREERLSQKRYVLGHTVQNLEDWLTKTVPSGAVIRATPAPRPTLRKGEELSAAVERCRHRVRELDADLQRIDTAPHLSAEAKRLAREQLEKLAADGRPRCNSLVRHGEAIEWPSVRNLGPGAQESSQDAVGLLAWVFGKQLAAALDAEIDAIADDGAALTAEQRAEQRATALRDKLAVEREEEALIRMAIAAGAGMMRRPDCDPRAVLGLADDLPGYAQPW